MNKKKTITFLTAAAIFSAGVIPTTTLAAKKDIKEVSATTELNTTNELSLGELNSSYQVSNYEQNGSIYTVTYVNATEKHVVIYNGENGEITIDDVTQTGLTYEYDPSKETTNTSIPAQSNSSTQISVMAAAPKSGYKYVGTISGTTQAAKDAAALSLTLATTIPGVGWGYKVAMILAGAGAKTRIPKLYYTYDLYQKGFMTTSWYQYTTTRMYKDKAHKKPAGKAWTSNPQKIDLPNS